MNIVARLFNTLSNHGLEAFGKYYSIYRAYVFNVEDPLQLGRLQLLVPQIYGNQVYKYWAHPKGVFSGKGYGSQCLPKKGDVVWVTFEGGHPEVPVWEHGHFANNEIPSNDKDLKDPACYWLITPKGNKIKLYDTKNLIHIENSLGYYLEENESGISLVTDKIISLGTLNKSKEPAVLGDTAMTLLNEFIKDLGNIGIIKTSSGVTGKINSSPLWGLLVLKWGKKWEEFKSTKVNLD